MKLSQLLEVPPDFLNKEMPVVMSTNTLRFYSEDTINREFEIIGKNKNNDEIFWTIIKKDKSFAVIGTIGQRKEDNKVGMHIVGMLDLKEQTDLSFSRLIKTGEHVLQVDSVEIFNDRKFQGIGYDLYLNLVRYGFVIISDHTQYVGGRKLWEKIVRQSRAANVEVFVIENGNPLLDDSNNPIVYDGTNIPDDKIWGPISNDPDTSKRYALLVLKKA